MELNIVKSLNLKHSIDNVANQIKLLGNNNICVIVPDKLSATMERLIFEKLQIESTFNIDICTLNRLSRNILGETKAQYSPISKIGGIILLKKVLNENNDLITSFKNTSHSYQYSNEIYKTLSQLKACQLSSEELCSYNCEIKGLKNKINDLGNIMQLYNQEKAGLLDNADTLTLTCMMLNKSESVKNTYYIFAGFVDFTSQGYYLIERLTSLSKGVYVNTYISSSSNKSLYYQDIFYRLITMCNTIGAKANILEPEYSDDDLHKYLTNNLFSFNKLNFNVKNENTIRLYQAQSIENELEFVARDIRKKILQGARYKNFGIGVFNLNEHVDTIRKVFSKYELCYYLDTQKAYSSTSLYRFFINLWQTYIKNYDSLNLIELISSPFIAIPDEHKEYLINCIKAYNYRGNFSQFKCENEEILSSIAYLNHILNKFELHKDSNIGEIITWHNDIITELNIENTINNLIDNFENAYDKKILSQAIKSSNTLLSEIQEFYPNSTLLDVLDIYKQAGMEMGISPLPLSADCIQIIDAGEILTGFDNLYLVNCTSSTAPTIMQDVGILNDKELTYVQLSHNIEPTIARINRINKFKLFNSVLMFKNNLCITMTLNSPSQTSPLVLELKNRIFVSTTKHEEANIQYITPYKLAEEDLYTPLSIWDLIEYFYTHNIENSASISPLLNKFNLSSPINNLYINEKFTHLTEISASALETYFQCPLKYFFNNILKLKDPINADIQMLDIGNILHELAYKYYKLRDRSKLDIKEFCNETIKSIILKDEKLQNHVNNPIIINLISEAERFITHLKEMDSNSLFIPSYFEKDFGNNFEFNSLPLTDTVSLKGKVDRIDVYDDYFRIIDYKSGNADASLSELYYGKKLQLFLYALAISKNTNKKISGMFYLPIKNIVEKAEKDENIYKLLGFYTDYENTIEAYDVNLPKNLKSEFVNLSLKKDGSLMKRSEKILSPAEMDILLDYAKQVSINAINEIQSGKFSASPLKFDSMHDACSYCPYLVLCSKHSNDTQFRYTNKVTKDSFKGEEDDE